jgi:hypothetical protein
MVYYSSFCSVRWRTQSPLIKGLNRSIFETEMSVMMFDDAPNSKKRFDVWFKVVFYVKL